MNLSQRGLWHRDQYGRGKWLFSAVVLVLLLVPPLWLAWPVLGDPTERFAQRKGEIRHVDLTRQWSTGNSRYQELTLHADSGLKVDVTVRRPLDSDEPQPLILLLGGVGTGRGAAELVQDSRELVVASISYPYQGPEKLHGWQVLWHFDEVQRAILDTTPALLLTLEHLAGQAYVDPMQMELVGVSLGAFFVSIAGAMDDRFSRVWLIQGAADPRAIYEYRLREKIRFDPLRVLAARLLGFVTASEDLKPERWVGRISPRPVVVINSHGDTAFPAANVAALHASLREPYELQWLAGEHVSPTRQQVLKQLNRQILERIINDNAENESR